MAEGRRSGLVAYSAHEVDQAPQCRVVGAVVVRIADDVEAVVDGRRVKILIERPRFGRKQSLPIVFRRAYAQVRGNGAEPRRDADDGAVLDAQLELAVAEAKPNGGVPESCVATKLGVRVGRLLHVRPISICDPVQHLAPSPYGSPIVADLAGRTKWRPESASSRTPTSRGTCAHCASLSPHPRLPPPCVFVRPSVDAPPCVPPLSTQNVNAPLVIPLGKTFDQPSINFSISRL